MLFIVDVPSILCMLSSLIRYMNCKYLLPFCGLHFYSLIVQWLLFSKYLDILIQLDSSFENESS